MSNRAGRSLIAASLALLCGSGAALAAAAPPAVEEEWKRVKAAGSPVAYARFLEAHPDFQEMRELKKRLAAASRRATREGRLRDLVVRRYEPVEPPAAASGAYLGEIEGAGGSRYVLLQLVYESDPERNAGSRRFRTAQGTAKPERRGSWAYFFAEADSAAARRGDVGAGRAAPILAVVATDADSMALDEVYVGGSPAIRLMARAENGGGMEPGRPGAEGAASDARFDEPPVALKIFTPEYPEEARQGKIEGVVNVQVTVSETGRVLQAEVVQSDTVPVLEEAAVRAALLSLFRPALHNGTPVRARIVLPFRFKLH